MKLKSPESRSRSENYAIYFDSLETASPDLWQKYRPKFVERGHDRVVYEIPSRPNLVIKVSLYSVEDFLRFQQTRGIPLDELPLDQMRYIRTHAKIERERFRVLSKFFERKHLLRYKKTLTKVPLTRAILQDLPSGPMHMTVKEGWAFVTIQERAPEVRDPGHLMLVSGYPESEDDDLDAAAYNQLTREVLFANPKKDDLFQRVVDVQKSDRLEDLVGSMLADHELKKVVRDFVQRTIHYSSESQEVIDIFGDDNVTFYKDKDHWNYRLIDPLHPITGCLLDMRQALMLLELKKVLSPKERASLVNGLNFVRVIHGLAHHLDVKERIPFADRFKKLDINYLKAIQSGEV